MNTLCNGKAVNLQFDSTKIQLIFLIPRILTFNLLPCYFLIL